MLLVLAIGDRRGASSRLRVWDHIEAVEGVITPRRADCVAPTALVGRPAALALRLLCRAPLWLWWFARARVVYTDAQGIGASVVAKSGAGIPVASVADWPDRLRGILTDTQARDELAAHGLAFASAEMSYDVFRELLKRLMCES